MEPHITAEHAARPAAPPPQVIDGSGNTFSYAAHDTVTHGDNNEFDPHSHYDSVRSRLSGTGGGGGGGWGCRLPTPDPTACACGAPAHRLPACPTQVTYGNGNKFLSVNSESLTSTDGKTVQGAGR